MSTNFTHKPGGLPGTAAVPASRGSPPARGPAGQGKPAGIAGERRSS
jgi:hypothetical protein